MHPDELTAEERAAWETLSPEEREIADRLGEVTGDFAEPLVEGVTAYISLDPPNRELDGGARLEARELIERIAEQWRRAELAGATLVAAVEVLKSEPILSLAGAIEDSLILALHPDPQHRHLMLSVDEALEREQALADLGHGGDGLVDPPAGKASEAQEELSERFEELIDLLGFTLNEALDFFIPLGKGGDFDEDAARDRMEELAVCLRAFDTDRGLAAAFTERFDVRPTLALLRTMVQGLVLRLSEDPARRAQFIPTPELGWRIGLIHEQWKAAYGRGTG